MAGSNDSIFAIGDCTASSYAPTAQVASQQGNYLARQFAQLAKKDTIEARLATLQTGPQTEETKNEADSLTKQLEKLKLRPFHYSHQGSLAYVILSLYPDIPRADFGMYSRYIGSDKAIADLPFFNGNVSGDVALPPITKLTFPQFASGGVATYLFWRSAYLSTLFSLRNRTLVATDWLKCKLFGRLVPSLLVSYSALTSSIVLGM
jgi:NADH:ubiquinone reductase (non-electrogenic)